MKPALINAIVAILIFGGPVSAQEHHRGGEALGTVAFATSCAPALRGDFNHAVALLHSFEYDEARDAFQAVAQKDPNCAMAHWGVAMTYFHGLWGEVDVDNGAAAAQRAREIADANKKTTAREKQYIEAVSAIYGQKDANIYERGQAFSAAMAKVYAANPDDDEAAIFNALSLAESAGRDRTYANQRKCDEILDPLFQKLPAHPGVAHYLIHCNDNLELAAHGLEAARAYAKIAPDSAHATHMPSHIFVRLGMWPETIESNVLSMGAAERDKAASPCQSRGNEVHAMHFLQFAYLQAGRKKEARSVVDRAMALPPVAGPCNADAAEVLADYLLESHEWQLGDSLRKISSDVDRQAWSVRLALGIADARSGDPARLRDLEQRLAAMPETKPGVMPELLHHEIAAWVDEAQGRHDEAVKLLRSAAELDDKMDMGVWFVPPAREMLGELLLQEGRNDEALAEFRAVLRRSPNLFLSLNGAARAAEAAGDRQTALVYYRKLMEVAGNGDRPEIRAARKKIENANANGAAM